VMACWLRGMDRSLSIISRVSSRNVNGTVILDNFSPFSHQKAKGPLYVELGRARDGPCAV